MTTLWSIKIKYDIKGTKETGKLFPCFAGIFTLLYPDVSVSFDRLRYNDTFIRHQLITLYKVSALYIHVHLGHLHISIDVWVKENTSILFTYNKWYLSVCQGAPHFILWKFPTYCPFAKTTLFTDAFFIQ